MSAGLTARAEGGVRAAELPAPRVRGVGLLTGWGEGLAALAAARPEPGAALVAVPTPVLGGERFRRATRECLLGAAGVRAATLDAGLPAEALAGPRTGLLYVSATAYAGANRSFLEDESSTTLHFPYTAPSALPGEVTIEYGLRGPYVNLMGGGPAALHALWYAAGWLAAGAADRVLVLAVEAVHEVRDLFARARRLYAAPLVEGAACLLLEPGDGRPLRWASAAGPASRTATRVGDVLDAVLADRTPRVVAGCPPALGPGRAERRALAARGLAAATAVGGGMGDALACAPLIGLMQARAAGADGACLITAAWRNDYGAVLWPL